MKDVVVPCLGIDIDGRWSSNRTKGWIFGYKPHMICSTEFSSSIIPISAYVTTVNVSDKPVYPDVVSYLSSETLTNLQYMVANPGFGGKKMYDLSTKRGFELIITVKRCKNFF